MKSDDDGVEHNESEVSDAGEGNLRHGWKSGEEVPLPRLANPAKRKSFHPPQGEERDRDC